MDLDVIVNGCGISGIEALGQESVHLVLSDIPYGIGADDWDVLHSNTNSALLGSSLVAAKRVGRRFVGFEKKAEFCEIAKMRIATTERMR